MNKEITVPYNDELFDIEGQIIDNEGAVYLKCIVYNEKRRKKRHGEPNYKYLLLKYTKDADTLMNILLTCLISLLQM